MGFSISAAFSIITVASLLSLGYISDSADFAISLVEEGFNTNFEEKYDAYNAEIKIVGISVTSNASSYDLEVKIENKGSVTLETAAFNVLIDGSLQSVDYYDRTYLTPDQNLTLRIYNLPGNGTKRLKAVTEYGNSDYATYEVT